MIDMGFSTILYLLPLPQLYHSGLCSAYAEMLERSGTAETKEPQRKVEGIPILSNYQC